MDLTHERSSVPRYLSGHHVDVLSKRNLSRPKMSKEKALVQRCSNLTKSTNCYWRILVLERSMEKNLAFTETRSRGLGVEQGCEGQRGARWTLLLPARRRSKAGGCRWSRVGLGVKQRPEQGAGRPEGAFWEAPCRLSARATERSGSPGRRTAGQGPARSGARALQREKDGGSCRVPAMLMVSRAMPGDGRNSGEARMRGLAGGLLDGREEGDARRRLAGRQQRSCTGLRRREDLARGDGAMGGAL
ncbi:hypothetical protein TRIUR3_31825 [Triticum urartu]|uniref:Uncharacterized protein n=1 Tax=Triticum urartu TaxID=4572 RepID=M7ZK05_TRIUA|nr:hypothetical protein TRIUR3_31825 [Triticum urartu]